MTDETLEATILNLRSQALSVLGLMKDMARRPTAIEDVGTLSGYAAQLAQLEGAMLTLQQYAPLIKQAGIEALVPPEATEVEVEETEEEPEEEEEEEENVLTEDELRKRSPTFRKSIKEPPSPPSMHEDET